MDEVWQIWVSGGWVMVPLFALAILLYTQAFQLFLYVRRNDLSSAGEMHWWDWVAAPERAAEPHVARIIEYTQSGASFSARVVRNRFDEVREALLALIDRRTKFVGTLVAAAPLLGLLGTVLGMLQTFLGISISGGAETAGLVAAGISQALVTTEAGLTIALPALFIVMIIRRRRHGLEAKLARLESLTCRHLDTLVSSGQATTNSDDDEESLDELDEEKNYGEKERFQRGRAGDRDQSVADDRLHLHPAHLFHRDDGLRAGEGPPGQ